MKILGICCSPVGEHSKCASLLLRAIKATKAQPDERETLRELGLKVDKYRQNIGKPPLICVVVEYDWPEYEPTWKAIEERVEQERKDNGQFGVGS